MRRRDFFKFVGVGVFALSLPAALSAQPQGSEWKEYYFTSIFDEAEGWSISSEHHAGALWGFRRAMEQEGYTEIRGLKHDVEWHPGHGAWLVLTKAFLR